MENNKRAKQLNSAGNQPGNHAEESLKATWPDGRTGYGVAYGVEVGIGVVVGAKGIKRNQRGIQQLGYPLPSPASTRNATSIFYTLAEGIIDWHNMCYTRKVYIL